MGILDTFPHVVLEEFACLVLEVWV